MSIVWIIVHFIILAGGGVKMYQLQYWHHIVDGVHPCPAYQDQILHPANCF